MNLDHATLLDLRALQAANQEAALAARHPQGPNAGAIVGNAIRAQAHLQNAALQYFSDLLDAAQERELLAAAVGDLVSHQDTPDAVITWPSDHATSPQDRVIALETVLHEISETVPGAFEALQEIAQRRSLAAPA